MNINNKIYGLLLFSLALCSTACSKDNGEEPSGSTELPRMAINNVTIFEGNKPTGDTARFKLTLSAAYKADVSVDYTTADGTAGAGIDFQARSGQAVIKAGQTQTFINIPIIGDTLRETDNTFEVRLSNVKNATLQTATGIGTIRNDDTYINTPADGYTTPASYPGYTLVWQDEFNGTNLDATVWTREQGGGGWGNNELQYYTDSENNAFLTGGNLVIEARKESFGGRDYTSARIISRQKKSFTFGRIDIRAKLPIGQGIWPALWMLGEKFSTVGWPACGEIDIMELVGNIPNRVHGTAHWGAQGSGASTSKTGTYSLPTGTYDEKFHVYTLKWQKDVMEWYVDDIFFLRITAADVNGAYPFNEPFFFIMNVAVGGNWPGSPNASTQFPKRMFVDYVRVFQQ